MANRSIFQQPFASNRVAGDVFMIDRSTTTLKLDESALPPTLLSGQIVVAAADVLTLFTTPVQVLPAADAGMSYIIRAATIEFANGSANYATNTTANLVSASVPTNVAYQASIANRTHVPLFVPQSGGSFIPGDAVSLTVATGNPVTGDSDLTITIWYYIMPTP